ncbi:MAG: hypothetical protein GY778_22135 [bacterium]|nr:hypothetical protein [bacterium]
MLLLVANTPRDWLAVKVKGQYDEAERLQRQSLAIGPYQGKQAREGEKKLPPAKVVDSAQFRREAVRAPPAGSGLRNRPTQWPTP